MTPNDLLIDFAGRVQEAARGASEGLSAQQLGWRPAAGANPIGWLVWHIARIQDDHMAHIAGREQAWTADGWAQRLGMRPDPGDHGYGHTAADVAAVRIAEGAELLAYLDAVTRRTRAGLEALDADDWDRVVDRSYEPPVTVGVRLVSMLSDNLQHAGQAAYVRGLLDTGG